LLKYRFILGGSTNSTFDLSHPNDTDYLNVFTLSLPAFRWFKSTDSDQVRRADHSCQLIGNKQMLVIGGTQPSNSLGIAAVEPWPNGLGIFDMSAFAWSQSYDPFAAAYEQPELVRDYYTYDYQAPVWDSAELEPVFGKRLRACPFSNKWTPYLGLRFANEQKPAWAPPDLPTGTYSTYPPTSTGVATITATATTAATPTPSSTSKPAPSSKTSHQGAIIGGTVGGVCAAVLALLVICLLLRKRRLNNAAKEKPADPKEPEGSSSTVRPKHELESSSPVSPGLLQLTYAEKEAEGQLLEMGSSDPSPRVEVKYHGIPRKPVVELP
jgi:hypothetical protein